MDKASEYTNSNWLFCLLSLFKDVYYTLKVDCLFAYFLSPNMFTKTGLFVYFPSKNKMY